MASIAQMVVAIAEDDNDARADADNDAADDEADCGGDVRL